MKNNARLVNYGLLLSLVLFPVLFVLNGCGEPEDASLPPVEELPYKILSQTPTWGMPSDIAFGNNKAYVAEGSAGCGVYDISAISAPVRLDTAFVEFGGEILPVRHVGLSEELNLIVFNVTYNGQGIYVHDLETLDPLNFYNGSGFVREMLVTTRTDTIISDYDHDYHESRMLHIINADPTTDDGLQRYSFHQDSSDFGGVDVYWRWDDDLNVSGFVVMDNSPSGLTFTSTVDLVAASYGELGVALVNVHRNVASQNGELLGLVNTPGEATKLTYSNGYVYAADGPAGMAILNFGDPNNLSYIDNWYYPGSDHINFVMARGNKLVAVDEFDGVFFFDITNPAAPEMVGMYEARGITCAEFLDDTTLGVGSETEGLIMLDLVY